MPDSTTYTDQMSEAAQKTRDAIAEAGQKAKGRAKEMAQTAADKIDEQRSTAADALHSASSTLHENAEKIPGETAPATARAAAERLESAAQYLEQHDTGEILDDMVACMKRNPIKTFAVAVGLG